MSSPEQEGQQGQGAPGGSLRKRIGLLLGPTLALIVVVSPSPEGFHTTATSLASLVPGSMAPELLVHSMHWVSGLLLLMVVWWVTEAAPLPVTALLPGAVLPLLNVWGVVDGKAVPLTLGTVSASYASPVIFLFLGGFLLAAAMRKWKLDLRITFWILSRGTLASDTRAVLLAMMVVSALLSMWISNTATAALMLPLGLGLLSHMGCRPGSSRFGTAVMLGIAWGAGIGGVGTIIGSPTNGVALGILQSTLGQNPGFERISFASWMSFGIPFVALFLPIAWLVLLAIFPPEVRRIKGGKELMRVEYRALGPTSPGERGTIAVLSMAAAAWVLLPFRDQLLPHALADHLVWLDEYTVGLLAGVALFLVPVDLRRGKFVLEWADTRFVEWGILLLFGGGIALSHALFVTGLASWCASSFVAIFGVPSPAVTLATVVVLVDGLTEVTSNTAVVSMVVPVLISIAKETGQSPTALAVAAAMASSMAFMLPVATPPNALAYSSGYIQIKDMIRAGVVLDLLGALTVMLVVLVLGSSLLGLF